MLDWVPHLLIDILYNVLLTPLNYRCLADDVRIVKAICHYMYVSGISCTPVASISAIRLNSYIIT